MRRSLNLLLLACAILSSACTNRSERAAASNLTQDSPPAEGGTQHSTSRISTQTEVDGTRERIARGAESEKSQMLSASVRHEESQAAWPVVERKIIRDADLLIEVPSPAEGLRRLASMAESYGGFVVTSESRQQTGGGGGSGVLIEVVNLQMRIPALRFDPFINEIRNAGGRVRAEKISGKDVTEEFIDLEAQLRAQRALEVQFREIMKRATTVEDALSVSSQLAELRGEIESIEGRRRFLDNQASLSTIKVTLQAPAPMVSAETAGFVHNLRVALGEGVDAALLIVLSMVRVAIALVPVVLLLALPLYYLVRYALRRRLRRAHPTQPDTVMP